MPMRLRSSKRPNYFTGQLLGEEDFQLEQAYQLGLHRGHQRLLHTWGVESGLEVDRADDLTVLVRPGSALDGTGRTIVVDAAQSLALHPANDAAASYLVLSYDEDFQPEDRSTDNTQNYTRHSEVAVLAEMAEAPPEDGAALLLAKVQFAGGKIQAIDVSARRAAGARVAPGAIGATELAPGGVTLAKLGAELRTGWVRMPFKPSSFVEPDKVPLDFFIGVTRTYCDHRGAKGTMAIPIPMLADRLRTFVIAGSVNGAQITIEVDRCGWDVVGNQHEKTTLLQKQLPKSSPFYQSFAINKSLDAANHSLAIYVEAAGEADISLVAAEFEYSLVK